jgi:hypothetical protein
MDENGKGPEQDDVKSFEERGETSGVFSLRRVQEAVEDKRAEVERMVGDALARQALFRKRAEVRNNFRSWAERVPFLAQTFREDFIPPMTAQQVANEERQRVERKAQRIARRDKNDVYMQAVHNYIQTAESPYRDVTQVQLEEKAKYMAGKVGHLFLRGNFVGAVNFFREHVADFPHPHEAEVFRDQIYEQCSILLTWIYNKAEFEVLPEALDAVFQMTKLEREDFPFLRVNEQNDAVKKVFVYKLCVAMSQHPAIYLRMRQTFLELGFIDAAAIDANPQIYEAMMDTLSQQIQQHPELYFRSVSQLNKAGVVNGDELHQSPEMRELIHEGLYKAMKTGPIAYISLRDRMEKCHLIDGKDYDQDESIQVASITHCDEWYGDKSKSYEGFVRFLSEHGISVPQNFIRHRAQQPLAWYRKLWAKFQDKAMGDSHAYLERCLQQSEAYADHFLSEELRQISETLRMFAVQYPMFRNKQ